MDNDKNSQSDKNFELFFDTIDDFLFVLDDKGNIIYINKTVVDRLGYSKEELIGKPILIAHPTERREEAERIVQAMLQGKEKVCPVPVITKSGIQIPVETRITNGMWDGKPALFGVAKDVSKLKLSEEKFSKVFFLNPSACGLSDLDTGKYVEVNEAFCVLFGFTQDEVIGKGAKELGIMTEKSMNDVKAKMNSDGSVFNVEAELKTKGGETRNVLMSAENIYVQDKKYRFTVVSNITQIRKDQKIIKEKIKELEKINGFMMDREVKMIELKKEIKELRAAKK